MRYSILILPLIPLLVSCGSWKALPVPVHADPDAEGPGLFDLNYHIDTSKSKPQINHTPDAPQDNPAIEMPQSNAAPDKTSSAKASSAKASKDKAPEVADSSFKDNPDYQSFKEYQQQRDYQEYKDWQQSKGNQ